MPYYDFECEDMIYQHKFTIKQGYHDPLPTRCPACDAKIHQIYSPVPFHFKGSGSSADIDKETPSKKQLSPTRQRIPIKIRDQEDIKLEGGITRRTSYL